MSTREHLQEEQLETIRYLFSENLPVLLGGGFAEDAWLGGKVRREHGDIDIATLRQDVDRVVAELTNRGFESEPYIVNEKIYKYVLRKDGVNIDVVPLDINKAHQPYIEIENTDGTVYRVTFSSDSLTHLEESLDGIAVRTVAPTFQVQARRTVKNTNRAGPREKDTGVLDELLTRFPNADKKPEIQKLN